MEQIKELEKQYFEAKDKYVNALLDLIVDEDTFYQYYPEIECILGVGPWFDDCPEFICRLLDDDNYDFNKGVTLYYTYILNLLEDSRTYYSDASNTEKDIINTYTTWELMQQIVDYTRDNKICGAIYDW